MMMVKGHFEYLMKTCIYTTHTHTHTHTVKGHFENLMKTCPYTHTKGFGETQKLIHIPLPENSRLRNTLK